MEKIYWIMTCGGFLLMDPTTDTLCMFFLHLSYRYSYTYTHTHPTHAHPTHTHYTRTNSPITTLRTVVRILVEITEIIQDSVDDGHVIIPLLFHVRLQQIIWETIVPGGKSRGRANSNPWPVASTPGALTTRATLSSRYPMYVVYLCVLFLTKFKL
jgi:hypothetical protein